MIKSNNNELIKLGIVFNPYTEGLPHAEPHMLLLEINYANVPCKFDSLETMKLLTLIDTIEFDTHSIEQIRVCLKFIFGSEKVALKVLNKTFLRFIAALWSNKKTKSGSLKELLQPKG